MIRLDDLEAEQFAAMKQREYNYYLQDFGIDNPVRPQKEWSKERSIKKRKSEVTQMATLKTQAKEYVAPETKNVADLELVSVEAEIEKKEVTKEDGTTFSYNYILHKEVEYRVPNIVLKQLKEQIEANPKLENFTVSKKGTGLNTTYTVIPK